MHCHALIELEERPVQQQIRTGDEGEDEVLLVLLYAEELGVY
jgi:hypothetical protein